MACICENFEEKNGKWNIYHAFNCFVNRLLVNRKSIFSDKEILTERNIDFLIENFINKKIIGSDKTFDGKIKSQFSGADSDQKELFAHVIWLWAVFANDMNQDSKIEAINLWLPDDLKIDNSCCYSFDHGIGSTGQYHKTNKPEELSYIIKFFDKIIKEKIKNNFIATLKEFQEERRKDENVPVVAMYNILLNLFEPDNFERIASYGHKEKIVSYFEEALFKDEERILLENLDVDAKLKKIREKIINDQGEKYASFHSKDSNNINLLYKDCEFYKFNFYHPEIYMLWGDYDLSFENGNVIYYGAPGTGKTYSVVESIKLIKNVYEGCRSTQVQFHPSFSYEDFMDGLKPVLIENSISLQLKNGVFKQFCIDAANELRDARKNERQAFKYYFIVDEINRADLSAVLGEVLSCLEEDKRLDFDKSGKLVKGMAIETQNSYLINDSRDAVHTEIVGIGKERYLFGVPSNVVFIGTMNDIDRSVDTFDFALRRRFTWIHKGFDSKVLASCEELSPLDSSEKQNYIKACNELNKYISENLDLGRSFEIGHAYFMKATIYRKTVQREKLFDQHLAPLIEEYLRSVYSAKDIEAKVKEAKSKFVDDKQPKKSKNKAD